MKNIYKWVPLLLCLFFSCSKEEYTFALDTDTITFTNEGDVRALSFSTNTTWEIILNADWLSVETTSGKGDARINLSAAPNENIDVRQTTVLIKSAGQEYTITVSQDGCTPYISIFPLQIQQLAVGGEDTVRVNTNFPYEVGIPDIDTAWLSVKNKVNNKFVLVVKNNTQQSARESNVTIQLVGTSVFKTLPVSQKEALKPNTINLSMNEVDAPVSGGEISLDLEANVIWDVYIPSGASWITLKSKSENNIKLTISPNISGIDRSATITVKNSDGSVHAECLISQASDGYKLTSEMSGSDHAIFNLTNWSSVNDYMNKFGFEYTEHPESCTTLGYAHLTMPHCTPEYDATLDKYVFRFDIHVTPFLDRDRCTVGTYDRQRNEMKSRTDNSTWAKIQGNYDEWQILE